MPGKPKKVLNIMLSQILGGTQQVYLDYHKMLKMASFEVLSVYSKGALITDEIKANFNQQDFTAISRSFQYSPITIGQLAHIIWRFRPDYIICHGNRAINAAIPAKKITNLLTNSRPKLVGVAHNYLIKHLVKCDMILAITNHLQTYIANQGYDASRIHLLPNTIDTRRVMYQASSIKTPICFGAMGRFVKKKGFDLLLKAAHLLKERGVQFKLIIGGKGDEEAKLVALASSLNLQKEVKFCGWVENKRSFFEKIDVFCLPSRHEPFGVVVLEAMLASKAVIATKSEGPSEIIADDINGMLADITPESLAEKMTYLAENTDVAGRLSRQAFTMLQAKYSFQTGQDAFIEAFTGCT